MLDEDELRTGLRALSAGPAPPAPGLAERSARRARVVRARRVVAGGLVTAAAALAAVPVVLPHPRPARPVTMSTSLLSWPDLRDPAWYAATDVALSEYLRMPHEPIPEDETVRWLYGGLVPGTGHVAAVWAYCRPEGCSRVVVARSMRENALTPGSEEGFTQWPADEAVVGPESPAAPVSTYLMGHSGAPDGPHTVLLVLAPPGTRGVGYSSPTLRAGTGESGVLHQDRGAYLGDIGYLSADARITVTGAAPYEGPAGTTDANGDRQHGFTRWVPDAVLPAPYPRSGSGREQLSGSSGFHDATRHGGRVAVAARCRGTAPVAVTVGRKTVHVACDGANHVAFTGEPFHGALELDYEATDPYTAFAVVYGFR
jgi:hypothetical protein